MSKCGCGRSPTGMCKGWHGLSKEEYEQFMKDVVPFEKSLLSKGVVLIKFWLSITQGKQEQRFTIRQQSPLKY